MKKAIGVIVFTVAGSILMTIGEIDPWPFAFPGVVCFQLAAIFLISSITDIEGKA